MTDAVVGTITFTAVIGCEPSNEELAWLVSQCLIPLPEEVAQSSAADQVLGSLVDALPGTVAEFP